MLTITETPYNKTWQALGAHLPRPKAILSVSAHWTTPGEVRVTAMERPQTIHDFGGFPQALYEQQYPAPGAPEWAERVCRDISSPKIQTSQDWGLDHGTWTVLKHLFPKADVPVFQLSLDIRQSPAFHFALGKALSVYREKGVLILGSGNVTHNLSQISPGGRTPDWAADFDRHIKTLIDARDHQGMIATKHQHPFYTTAHPTDEHFLPLLYTAAQDTGDSDITWFNDDFDMGSISMRSFILS